MSGTVLVLVSQYCQARICALAHLAPLSKLCASAHLLLGGLGDNRVANGGFLEKFSESQDLIRLRQTSFRFLESSLHAALGQQGIDHIADGAISIICKKLEFQSSSAESRRPCWGVSGKLFRDGDIPFFPATAGAPNSHFCLSSA